MIEERCKCVCSANHPASSRICRGAADTRLKLANHEIPMCAACIVATLGPSDPLGRTIFEQPRPDGGIDLEIAPGQYVCDFCLTPNPSWEYPCGPVRLIGNPNATASDDQWLACDRCRELIDAGNVDHAAAEMVDRQRKAPLTENWTHAPLAEDLAVKHANLTAFLAARTGAATLVDYSG